MIIKIDSIKDLGNKDRERIILSVIEGGNLGEYLVMTSSIIKENVFSSKVQSPYWFPDQELNKGDLVVLYTTSGTNSSTQNENGSKTYFYYWGLDNPISNIKNYCVVLFKASWEAYPNAPEETTQQ